jgi:hypothetical protein
MAEGLQNQFCGNAPFLNWTEILIVASVFPSALAVHSISCRFFGRIHQQPASGSHSAVQGKDCPHHLVSSSHPASSLQMLMFLAASVWLCNSNGIVTSLRA